MKPSINKFTHPWAKRNYRLEQGRKASNERESVGKTLSTASKKSERIRTGSGEAYIGWNSPDVGDDYVARNLRRNK